MDHNLPVTFGFWMVALLPLAALLVMLIVFKWSGPVSGWLALLLAIISGFFMFDTPIDTLLVAGGKGLWDALFILLVVWTALLLYQVSDKASAFDTIREGVMRYSKNYLFLVLAFGWVFSSFLQGVAGFGAPIAIVAPLLVGIGVKPVFAVVIPLIGHAWAKMFGSLGVGWLATIQIIDLENETLTAVYTSILLWVVNLIGGLAIAYIYGKWKGIKEGLPAILIISGIHGVGQVVVSMIDPVLSTFIPSIFAMGALYFLAKWDRYSEESDIETEILESDQESENEEEDTGVLSLKDAAMPYVVLTVTTVLGLGIPPITSFLEQFEIGFGFPEVTTGYDYTTEAVEVFSPLAIFTHPGFYILIATIFGYFWYNSKGAYGETSIGDILKAFWSEAKGTTISIIAFLALAQILEHSGQTPVLALGIAAVSPPIVYAALSSWLGVAGAFITSSNTSSNILLSPLHEGVVSGMEGLSLALVIAGQSVGAALGNVIAPANVMMGASTAGIEGENSSIMKYTLKFTIIVGVILSICLVLMYLLFPE